MLQRLGSALVKHNGIPLDAYVLDMILLDKIVPDTTGVADCAPAINAAILQYSGSGFTLYGNPASTYRIRDTISLTGVKRVGIDWNYATILDDVQGNIPTSGQRPKHTFMFYDAEDVWMYNVTYDITDTRTQKVGNQPWPVVYWIGGQYLGNAMTRSVHVEGFRNVVGKALKGFVVSSVGELDGLKVVDFLVRGGNWQFGINFEYGLRPEDAEVNGTLTNGLHPYNIYVERFNGEDLFECQGFWRTASCYNVKVFNCTAYNVMNAAYIYGGDRNISRFSQNVLFENVKIKFDKSDPRNNKANYSVSVLFVSKDGSTNEDLESWNNLEHSVMFINCEVQSTIVENSSAYRIFGNAGKTIIQGGLVEQTFYGLWAEPSGKALTLSEGALVVRDVNFRKCFQFLHILGVKGYLIDHATFRYQLVGSTANLPPCVLNYNTTSGSWADGAIRDSYFDAFRYTSGREYINIQGGALDLTGNNFVMKVGSHNPVLCNTLDVTLTGRGNKGNYATLTPQGLSNARVIGEPCSSKSMSLLTSSEVPFNSADVWSSGETKTVSSIVGGKPGDVVEFRGVSGASKVTFEFGTVTGENRIVPLTVATDVKTGNGWSKRFRKLAGSQGWWEF